MEHPAPASAVPMTATWPANGTFCVPQTAKAGTAKMLMIHVVIEILTRPKERVGALLTIVQSLERVAAETITVSSTSFASGDREMKCNVPLKK